MILSLFLVAVCWGFTNPFIKRGTKGLSEVSEKYSGSSFFVKHYQELRFLCKPSFLIPFLINLSGSFVYYSLLGDSHITLAVPVCNSLTFALTGVAGLLLGEDFGTKNTLFGMILIIIGVLLCVTA
jgi:drug/metabolite transporter (DMT)-like permease